ncbi:MAG TPA: hypothetical protein VNV85_01915, partial [Puia sp.]|nr:hypothetical protein [Puia sp.]
RGMSQDREITDSNLTIAPDSFLLSTDYQKFLAYRNFKQRLADQQQIDVDSLVESNPQFYHTYVLAGDYFYKKKQFRKAQEYYQIAQRKVIATKKEDSYIKEQIAKCMQQ